MAEFLSMDNILTGDEAAALFEGAAVEEKLLPLLKRQHLQKRLKILKINKKIQLLRLILKLCLRKRSQRA